MNLRKLFLLWILVCPVLVWSQKKSSIETPKIQFNPTHDSLLKLMYTWVNDSDVYHRMEANGKFIKLLGKTLKEPEGYSFSFDTLKNVSCLSAPDHSFRIITWMFLGYDGGYRHYGCIQFEANNKVIPLSDRTEYISFPEDTILNPQFWYGAAYYQLIPFAKKKYLLIGFNKTEPFINKKVLDVLDLSTPDKPLFGSPVFATDSTIKTPKNRQIFQFSVMASMILRYEEKEKKILVDHLVPIEERFRGMYFNYVPDGSLDAYRLKKGKWIFTENVVFGK